MPPNLCNIESIEKGNLKLFSIPELVTPKFLERYDPEYSDNVKQAYLA